MKIVEDMLAGSRLSLARLISKVENRGPELEAIMTRVYPHTGHAQIWGITGPPGSGKSTLVDQIISQLRAKQKKVAVVAVDPSSPFSGGAILGDRIRMQKHVEDPGVYIRSVGTRGRQGGLSHSAQEVVLTLDAAGFDVVLVETAGVGQTELDILSVAHSILVILVPESGDSIQVMKAGLMEIADVFVVNKSDRPEADRLVRELRAMVGLIERPSVAEAHWIPSIHKTEAVRGIGVEQVLEALEQHQKFLLQSGKKEEKNRSFLKYEVIQILTERLRQSVLNSFKTSSGEELLEQMLNRQIDPYKAADLISGN